MRWCLAVFISIQLHLVSSSFLSNSAQTETDVTKQSTILDLSYTDQVTEFLVSCNPIITPPKTQDYQLTDDQWQFYRRYLTLSRSQTAYIFDKTEHQDNNRWKSERQIRITTSIAYALYTYAKESNNRTLCDWQRKIGNFAFKDVPPNKYTEYGRNNEVFGLEIFHDMIGNLGGQIYARTGLMININAPWLAFSPDAFVKINKQLMLVEVKCPVVGQITEGLEFLKRIDFIQNVNGSYELRKRSINYAQMQLEMLLTNLPMSKLVLYCKKDESIHVIDVPFDAEYVQGLFSKLKTIYFKHYLPFIYFHKNKLFKIKYGP